MTKQNYLLYEKKSQIVLVNSTMCFDIQAVISTNEQTSPAFSGIFVYTCVHLIGHIINDYLPFFSGQGLYNIFPWSDT